MLRLGPFLPFPNYYFFSQVREADDWNWQQKSKTVVPKHSVCVRGSDFHCADQGYERSTMRGKQMKLDFVAIGFDDAGGRATAGDVRAVCTLKRSQHTQTCLRLKPLQLQINMRLL